MNQQIKIVQLPDPPDIRPFIGHRDQQKALADLGRWTKDHHRELTQRLGEIRTQINSQVQGVGAPITSAPTITIPGPGAIYHVTGTASIATINAPSGFSGPVFILVDGAFRFVTGGNIVRALGPFTIGQVVMPVFDPATGSGMWYV